MTSTTTGLRISEVAERTGFSGPTLRYYDKLGLVAPGRTAAGYREYDDRDVARLDVIARAKRLGCSLEEIKELLEVWDEDRCAPVQHHLRSLVMRKAREAQSRIDGLVVFTAGLQATAARLAGEPVDDACGDGCACVSADATRRGATDRQLVTGTVAADVPIACTLDGEDRSQRLSDWHGVIGAVVRREPLVAGVRLVFGAAPPLGEIARLMAAEYECCPFFAFALTVDTRGTALEVLAPADGAGVLAAAFGTAA